MLFHEVSFAAKSELWVIRHCCCSLGEGKPIVAVVAPQLLLEWSPTVVVVVVRSKLATVPVPLVYT